jgi:hypothetical protein
MRTISLIESVTLYKSNLRLSFFENIVYSFFVSTRPAGIGGEGEGAGG